MNLIKKVNIIILVMMTFSACERDDICPEDVSTTPLLLLEFYDITNQENLKNVANIFIQGIGNDNPLPDYNGDTNENSVELPLKTNENSTSFRFIKNYALDSDGNQTGNEDIITINYVAENVYVSRACGYKTIYRAVSIQLDDDEMNRWIVLAQPLNNNQSIEDETTTHFNFFH